MIIRSRPNTDLTREDLNILRRELKRVTEKKRWCWWGSDII
jgi:hypothetical protein